MTQENDDLTPRSAAGAQKVQGQSIRTELGYQRTSCACYTCVRNCKFMPSFLVPSDLERMIPPNYPPDFVPREWAEANLLASAGALVMKAGEIFRIPTLVPAVKADGSCIHLNAEDRCTIHEVAPFGCAYFDCGPERGELSRHGLQQVLRAWHENALYARIWQYLHSVGRRQQGPEVLRARMAAADGKEEFHRSGKEIIRRNR